jgi:hypothetical protein
VLNTHLADPLRANVKIKAKVNHGGKQNDKIS